MIFNLFLGLLLLCVIGLVTADIVDYYQTYFKKK